MNSKRLYGILALLGLLVIVAYSPALSGSFVNYDDPAYVTGNTFVRNGLSAAGIGWAFTSFDASNWHPVTWLSHMLDVQMFGMNATGHHVSSLLLHLANTLLLFTVLRMLTGATGRSLVVAALFALHPLHVESVAWVAERKDVLSTFFGLLTIWAYHGYVTRRSVERYLGVLVLFALGLMAKPMLVTLPFVLLLIDYWPLRRFDAGAGEPSPTATRPSTLLVEKLPLFALSAASSVITYFVHEGAMSMPVPLSQSLGNALITPLRYLQKTVWPSGLAPFYPFDASILSTGLVAGAALLLLVASLLVLWQSKRRPYLVTGWFWYLGTLVPVVGIIKVGDQAMADRYTYIPLIGIFIVVVWGGYELANRLSIRKEVLASAAAVLLVVLSVLTWRQTSYWHDSITLFNRALAVTGNSNITAHVNLAQAYGSKGEYAEALQHINIVLQAKPEPVYYVNQAWLYSKLGEFEKSNDSCQRALAIDPNNEKAHFLAGLSDLALKRLPAAIAEYSYLQRSNSRFADQLAQEMVAAGVSPAALGAQGTPVP